MRRLELYAPRLWLAAAAICGATAVAAPCGAQCADCDGDGVVGINELITGITIALGTAPLSACDAFDRDGDGKVVIAELIAALNQALTGCPTASPTPTPTVPDTTPTARPAQVPPTTPEELLPWLQAGSYLTWPSESGVHPSDGPHGAVRTYVNDTLFASLQAGGPHPAGAAAVKELYARGGDVTGWAVMVKVQDDSDRGRGWYWYEYFGSGEPYSGIGLGVCTGCHSLGRDFVRIPFPLQ